MKKLILVLLLTNSIYLKAQEPEIFHFLYPDFILEIENEYPRSYAEVETINGIKNLNKLTVIDTSVILIRVRDISKEYSYHGNYSIFIQQDKNKWFGIYYDDYNIKSQGFFIVTDERLSTIDSTFITRPDPPFEHTIHVNHWLKSLKDGKWISYTYDQSGLREENEVNYIMGKIVDTSEPKID